ncbi:4Fe-4S ferredoxin, iron-sulfur binding domain protein [Peptoclostridium acidaminophilum DSM 3953]|uniref:4Fe-4S ferredoxin, iron-sulfur binding domain protein n=1 Tax=Peptoclostridium acidaminophilum DSM 3953 TaxID=1286171 RepID=W8TM07_PEPAC|nr:EFR1 family ferrodoxin [Peptoclostridium acidaminophilum]AHM57217.1 4Fe-4S ferredoxin, iron-sulfur binding domain protein [Peptoclostridium acidaminophilum DSM 3953]
MAKTVIFYFTGTGNSLAVARRIAKHLPDAALVPMLKVDAMTYIGADTNRVGLVYPVHMNAVPRAVVKFIRTVNLVSGHYVFAVVTHGGMPGMAGLHMYDVLKNKHIGLDAYFEVEMIMNTPKGVAPKPLMRLDWELDITPDVINPKLKKANFQAERIARSVLGKERKNIYSLASKSKSIGYFLMNMLWCRSEESRPRLDFILDDCCTGCGICEAVCTTNRIKMIDGRPEWVIEDCNYCYACFNYCPVQAIGVKYYIKKLGRYHHPQVSAADIASQTK